ncbi:MAG: hypothetical protein CMH32_06820 [Micavibrio sp.]|nr:hypothetical protein [Micavibrio sp.]HCK32250.1 hypothetical protein [Rhodospirillaceae bacterium]|tara:strand:+ start:1041 stop:1580 length:540 start_codon:yes stop_codon:yes gene_type:complete
MSKNVAIVKAIEGAVETIRKAPDDKKPALLDSLLSISQKLMRVTKQFSDIPDTYVTKLSPMIEKQLSAAERRTERAADQFLTVAEEIKPLLDGVDEATKKEIQNKLNEMFEISTFQDLVAQHLNEVKLLMNDLTYDIEELQEALIALGDSSMGGGKKFERSVQQKRSDEHLLNGPSTDF